jgi:hypothetical protein
VFKKAVVEAGAINIRIMVVKRGLRQEKRRLDWRYESACSEISAVKASEQPIGTEFRRNSGDTILIILAERVRLD